MAPKKTTRKKAAKKLPRKPSAKSAKNARRAGKAPKKVAPKKKVAKKPVARKATKKVVARKATKKVVAKKATKKVAAKKSVAKKPAKKAAKRPVVKKAAAAVQYRDNAGHIDPGYAAKLREQSGQSSPPDHAFLDGPRSNDSLAEELGEETVAAMTTGEDESDRLEQEVDEDGGGPFVETDGSDEFADGTDESNPETATREPFPTS